MINIKTTYRLSFAIAILTFVVSAGGFFIGNLYRDNNVFALSAWAGNDLVTLFLALPLLLGSLFLYIKGSLRGQLFWLGMLDYNIYNFAFYLFGAAFNYFFPLYVALFVLSILTMIFGMLNLNVGQVREYIKRKVCLKFVSVYMFFMAGGLGFAWLSQWLSFVITGKLPEVIAAIGDLIPILDLSFIVSIGILAAKWLWEKRTFGYVLAVTFNVKCTVYNVVLIAGCFTQAKWGVKGAFDLLFVWLFCLVGCLTSTIYLLGNFNKN